MVRCSSTRAGGAAGLEAPKIPQRSSAVRRRRRRPTGIFDAAAVLAALIVVGCTTARLDRSVDRSPALASAGDAVRSETAESTAQSTPAPDSEAYIAAHYTKREVRIPMRDGMHLFTAIYEPRDRTRPHPIMLFRTPYSVRPYGDDQYPSGLGPYPLAPQAGYIFVNQDVRGCYMSEGQFTNMTPHVDDKQSHTDVDESSDTYDTIEWLIRNLENHNGRVGMWGISYPGFYAAAGMIDAHPALVAVSPQAPIADWFFDDFHHHGAFFLPHCFNFMASFGRPRPDPTQSRSGGRFRHGTPDGYQFFLDLGPLKNANERYLHGEIEAWNEIVAHPNYDEYWQRRNILPHLHRVAPAVMTVGGWFDAEDLYGPLKIYRAVERGNPDVFNVLVMGPWPHGGWRGEGERLGNIDFGAKTGRFYHEIVIAPFFEYYLLDAARPDLPEACVFQTGVNRWRTFDAWPPRQTRAQSIYVAPAAALSFEPPPADGRLYDEFISDPAHPVPYTQQITTGMTRSYMTEDQRFASRRPDVLTYQTNALDTDVTFAGPIQANLWVSTSATASDWVVKVIDVFPPDAPTPEDAAEGVKMGGYQMMVRSEVIRGRFRNSYERPEPFMPDQPTLVPLELLDVLHTFQKGHRVMVQIQCTWFPLVDRNPHRYVDNVFLADESDFIPAVQRVYHSPEHPTHLVVGVLPESGP
ncbi:MAG: CocE/NonD family hydrolase [Phycisphaerales bacterium]|nr:MAG: CocE/NonD family hydrolase [Phycisphaerales bacterium]